MPFFETGVIVLGDVPPDAEACHLVAVVIVDLHTVEEMKFLIQMGEFPNLRSFSYINLVDWAFFFFFFFLCSYLIKVGCF